MIPIFVIRVICHLQCWSVTKWLTAVAGGHSATTLARWHEILWCGFIRVGWCICNWHGNIPFYARNVKDFWIFGLKRVRILDTLYGPGSTAWTHEGTRTNQRRMRRTNQAGQKGWTAEQATMVLVESNCFLSFNKLKSFDASWYILVRRRPPLLLEKNRAPHLL